MLDRQRGNIFWSCDECGEVLETGSSDFDAARHALRINHWRTKKEGDEWIHLCPDCQN